MDNNCVCVHALCDWARTHMGHVCTAVWLLKSWSTLYAAFRTKMASQTYKVGSSDDCTGSTLLQVKGEVRRLRCS